MCSIIGSFDKDKLVELADLNRYRGEHSHSLYVFCPETYGIKFQHKALGANNKKIYSKNTRDRMINEIERIKKILFTDDTVKPTFFLNDLENLCYY